MNAVSSRVTSKKENLDLKHSSGWSPRQKPLTWTQLPTVEFRSARRCCVGQLGRYPNSSGIQNIIDLHTGAQRHIDHVRSGQGPLRSIIGQGQINVCGVNDHPRNVRNHTVLTLEATPLTVGYNWGKT